MTGNDGTNEAADDIWLLLSDKLGDNAQVLALARASGLALSSRPSARRR